MSAERREVLMKAFEESAAPEVEKEEKVEATEAASTPSEPEVKAAPEESVEKVEKAAPEKTEDPAYAQEKKVASDREKEPAQRPELVTDRAPVSWKPAQREKWGKLDPEIRAEISRREKQIQETLTQTDNVRKFANEFAQIVQPYSHLIAAQRSTPLAAVSNLMRTAAGLSMGSQEQKAQIISEIIGNYGVDLETLDRVLSKAPPRQGAPTNEQPPSWARPMFDFMNNIEAQRQQFEQRQREQAQNEISRIAEKPFFEDLREEMADIIEVGARRGVTITLDQAYDRAVALNPEISSILAQRKAAEQHRNPVSEAAAVLARQRKAASTVKGGPSTTTVASKSGDTPLSRREAIERAMESQEQRV